MNMSSRHVPTSSLLRYLARLTRSCFASQHFRYSKQQQRCFSRNNKCSAKPSSLAQSPRARRAAREIGASWASARYEDNNAPKRHESLLPFADVLFSKWVMKDFADLGLQYRTDAKPPPQFVLDVFLGKMGNGWSPVSIMEWFTGTGREALSENGKTFKEVLLSREENQYLRPLADPRILGQAIYILGYQFIMSTQKNQRDLGEQLLKVAELMRNRDATTATLLSNYRRKSASEPAPQAFSTLDSLAKQGNDIGAMCLRAEMLMWPKKLNTVPTAAQRSQAYGLALKAFEKSEAGPPIPPPPPPRVAGPVSGASGVSDIPILPPWLLLQRIIEDTGKESSVENLALWKKVVEAGAREYDDPSACERVTSPASSIMPTKSTDWIKFATKAAMAGQDPAAFHLGQYYLELHGWHPPKSTSRKRDKIGFQWMEVSLMQIDNPAEIQRRAFLMALLLRENGDIDGGMRWLKIGAERIDEVAKITNTDIEGCAEASRYFKLCQKDWYLSIPELTKTEPTLARTLERDWKVDNYYPPPLLPKNAGKDAAFHN